MTNIVKNMIYLKELELNHAKWRFKNELKPVANLKHDYDCKGIM